MAIYSVADAGGLLGHAKRRERDDDAVGGREFAGPQRGRGLAVKAPGEFAPFSRRHGHALPSPGERGSAGCPRDASKSEQPSTNNRKGHTQPPCILFVDL